MIHRINVFLLSLFIVIAQVFTVSSVYAGPEHKVDWELKRLQFAYQQEIAETKKRVQAEFESRKIVNGTAVTTKAVVESAPTASKVGSSMFKRVSHYAKTPGVQMIAVMSAVQLIEAIGWVMEDGAYVKLKEPEDPTDPDLQFKYKDGTIFNTVDGLGRYAHSKHITSSSKYTGASCRSMSIGQPCSFSVFNESLGRDSAFDAGVVIARTQPVPERERVHLTPSLLGAAMMGTGYNDPVDPSIDESVNTGEPGPSVLDAYKEEPTDIGNELYNELENKADNAPTTKTGKPSPLGDPAYNKPLKPGDDAGNDRKGDDAGNEGKTENQEKTDPETGEKTNSGTFKLPEFCDWAATVCEWYEGWKKTDTKVNQHMSEEKDMWTRIRNFFGWATEEPTLKSQELQIDDVEIEAYERSEYVKFGATCPFSPSTASLPMGILGSMNFEIDLTFICRFGEDARPFVQGLGYLGGLIYLMVGLRNGNG